MSLSASGILLLLSWVASCQVAVYDNVTRLPSLKYDFVIVGGGTAGNVVANRLTENPGFSVLVLEAGGSNIGVLDSIVPGLDGGLFDPTLGYTWYIHSSTRGREQSAIVSARSPAWWDELYKRDVVHPGFAR